MEYNALILLPPDISVSLNEISKILSESSVFHKTDTVISIKDDYLIIGGKGWSAQIAMNSENYVLAESIELSEEALLGGRTDAEEIAVCNRRLEVDFTDDANATHFNSYIYILQELGGIKNAKVFDQAVGEFV